MKWSSHNEKVAGGRGLRFVISWNASPASCAQVLRGWREDAEFRAWFVGLLAGAPFAAFRWETPPVTTATVERTFEFVLLDSPELAVKPSANAYAAHFGKVAMERGVVEFANFGRDAILIVPCPQGPDSAYGHLAAFVREAPEAQQHALWTLVGEAMERQIGATPVWPSTAGAGVPWLHVRLDNRPKYYGYGPYRDSP